MHIDGIEKREDYYLLVSVGEDKGMPQENRS